MLQDFMQEDVNATRVPIILTGATLTLRRAANEYAEVSGTIVFNAAKKGVIDKVVEASGDSVVKELLTEYPNANVVKLKAGCQIFPGLIDIHQHIDYNLLPIWTRPNRLNGIPWDNRHEWRHKNCAEYNADIKGLRNYLFDEKNWNGLDSLSIYNKIQFFCEVQAVSGGTVVMQEPADLTFDDVTVASKHILLRSTGVSSDLGINANLKVNSVIDFYKPQMSNDTSSTYYPPINTYYTPENPNVNTAWKVTKVPISKTVPLIYVDEYIEFLRTNSASAIATLTGGFIVHLAEGRAGNLCPGGKKRDAYSNLEFTTLRDAIMAIPEYYNKVRASRLTIIHGCGIDLSDALTAEFIKDCNIFLVWSPVSNLLLYDDTPNYLATVNSQFYESGLICLGSDWAPSGSKHVWDEAIFASEFIAKRSQEYCGSYDLLLDMITHNPAKALSASKLGEIKSGNFADFYIVSPDRRVSVDNVDSIGNVFKKFSDYNSVGTIIDGDLVFGITELFKMFKVSNYKPIAKDKVNADLNVIVPSFVNFDKDLEHIDYLFRKYSAMNPGKSYVRSNFLSFYDEPYKEQIGLLKRKFC
jgi:hypothetical protein